MTAHDRHLPTPALMAYALQHDALPSCRFRAAMARTSRRPLAPSTTEWLCPVTLTVTEADSRITRIRGEYCDLVPATDRIAAEIICDLRDGFHEDAIEGIAELRGSFPDDRTIATWNPRDGVRFAHARLIKDTDDGEARHLAADISDLLDLTASIEGPDASILLMPLNDELSRLRAQLRRHRSQLTRARFKTRSCDREVSPF